MEQDVDKLLKLAEVINSIIDIGEEVMEDGELNFSDFDQVAPLAVQVKNLVDLRNDLGEMIAEGKDIDPMEAVQLVQALLAKK